MEKTEIVILGAGIAGLGAATRAKELGLQSVIYEASVTSGGLLDNFSFDGFRFDNAVHLSFATEQEVREVFDLTSFYTHPSDSFNFDEGCWLKHPVQNNLFPLPADRKTELLTSFMERDDNLVINNYEDWLRHQYGDLIAEQFPLKYTKKYWQCDASELSTNWIGNRMRRANPSEILYGSYSGDTPNTYYTKEMRYPKKGGFKAFIKPLIDSCDIFNNHKATEIDLAQKKVKFENGSSVHYGELISSIPLPVLVKLCSGVPPQILEAAKHLKCTSIDLISVGFNEDIIKKLWFYIYDTDIKASRAYSPSVKSPDNAPSGCSSLQFEIYNSGQTSQYTPEELKENTLYALNKMGIAESRQIKFVQHKHLKWGNVVFNHGMEENRDLIRKFFLDQGIKTVGRFGEWDYLWSNQAYMSGRNSLNSHQ